MIIQKQDVLNLEGKNLVRALHLARSAPCAVLGTWDAHYVPGHWKFGLYIHSLIH